METIKESEIPKYYGEGSSGAYVLFYQAVDMDREALGLPPDLPTSSAVDVVNEASPVGATIVVDPASPPPDVAAGVTLSKDGEEAASSPSSLLPNTTGPATTLTLDLPPPALNTSPLNSPVLLESVSKPNTPGLTKGAAGFFQSLRHSASSKASMAKEKEAREREKDTIPPVPTPPLLNGDVYTNGHANHANGVKEKEGKEGGGNIFRRSLKVTKKRETISVHPGSGSPALPASPRLPPSPNDYRRPSGPQVPPTPVLAAATDETSVTPPPLLPLPVAGLPLPTRGSTIDDTNTTATASVSSSWTSASAPGPLSPMALPLQPPSTPPLNLEQDAELPLPVLPPPDRMPSPDPAGSTSGRTGMVGPGTGTGTRTDVANSTPGSHSKSNSSEFPPVSDPFQPNNINGQGQLSIPLPLASSTSVSVAGQPSGSRSSGPPTPTFKISLGGGEAKKQKAVSKAIEEAQVREKKALEEKTRKMREERERRSRSEKEKEEEREREKDEREKEKEQQQQQQQQNNKPQKRAARKMSLSGMTVVGRLGASFGWSKDKDKHSDKDKDKGTTGVPPIPQVVRRGSHHTPSNEAEQDLQPPVPGYFAIGASPKFNS